MAIGVNGNSNQIDLQKLMQARMDGKTAKSGAQKKAPGMSMNESIFDKNAQMVSGQKNSVSNAKAANTSENIANVNTAKSIGGIIRTEHAKGAEKAEGTQEQNQEEKHIDLGNVDFDNLGNFSNEELKGIRNVLKQIIDKDVPLFMSKPFEQKLDKVESEIQNRNEMEGNKLSNDNAKAEENQKKSIEEKNNEAQKSSGSSASDGKAATRQAEQGTATINKTSSDMKTQAKNTKDAEKKLKTEMAKGEKLVAKNEKNMQKASDEITTLAETNDQINTEIENLSGQIEGLGENTDSSELESLQAQINEKSQSINSNQNQIGKKAVTIKKLQSSTGKTIRKLSKSSQTFNKTMVQTQKTANESVQEQSKVLDIANKADEISGYVATAGQMTQYVGKGMIALGSAMVVGGQALISAGMVTEKVGIGVETVGNIGKAAANVTKMAVYAAEGNIMGALMSAGSAVMSGASAAKGVKEIKGGFQSVEQQGAKAAEKLKGKTADKAKQASEKAAELRAVGGEKNLEKATALDNKAESLVGKESINELKETGSMSTEKLGGKAGEVGKFEKSINDKIDANNMTRYDKAVAKASKSADKTEFNNMVNNEIENGKEKAASKWAEAADKKFAGKMEKAMQFGNFAMTAASKFGANRAQGGGGTAAPRAQIRAAAQHSTRRRIA